MKTHEHFTNEINLIVNPDLRRIVEDTLDASPDCIVTIPASSSGKYHPEYTTGEGGLLRHVKAAVGIAKCMTENDTFYDMIRGDVGDIKTFDCPFKDEDEIYVMLKDAMYAAIILHDCMKPDNTEKHTTQFDHPLKAAALFKEMAAKHISQENMAFMKVVIPYVHAAIASHMGKYTTAPYARGIVLPKPKSSVAQYVHMCDYLASRKFLTFEFDKYK